MRFSGMLASDTKLMEMEERKGTVWEVQVIMESFLRKSFLEYVHSEPDDVRRCLDINSVFNKPRYYYTVFYNHATDQLICEGYSKARGEAAQECFKIWEGGSTILTGDFLLKVFPVSEDASDLFMHGYEAPDFLDKPIVDWKSATVWSHG